MNKHKFAFTPAEVFHPAEQSKKIASRIIRVVAGVTSRSTSQAGALRATAPYRKFGFTLAEVLIPLGIIGVVAALTMPSLIGNYKKRIVETKLKQTYSIFNQAIRLSEIKNGEASTWVTPNVAYNSSLNSKECLGTYILPYLNGLKKFEANQTYVKIFLNNGIYTYWAWNGWHFEVYTRLNLSKSGSVSEGIGGKDYFLFYMRPNFRDFVPAGWQFSQTKTGLMNEGGGLHACNNKLNGAHINCARLIMLNGWRIPVDYPFKF